MGECDTQVRSLRRRTFGLADAVTNTIARGATTGRSPAATRLGDVLWSAGVTRHPPARAGVEQVTNTAMAAAIRSAIDPPSLDLHPERPGGAPARASRHVASTSPSRDGPDAAGMWMHSTHRLVARPADVVRIDIDRLVRSTWARATTVTTTEHQGRRADWIATGAGSDDLDVVLTWTLIDLDTSTFVTLTLDEMEPGPDPVGGLEAILDMLTEVRVVG